MNALAEVFCIERSYEMSSKEFEDIIDFLKKGTDLLWLLLQERIRSRGEGLFL